MIYHEELAPVCLFVYNRPQHTRTTIDYLKRNELAEKTALYIFSDGARGAEGSESVSEVRKFIREISGFKEIHIMEQTKNLGLSQSIISGVTKVVNIYGKAIILEDDIVTSPYFLMYMNDGLRKYAGNDKVASIHGYCYPVKSKLPETFFIKGADCWGWGTWKNAWDKFEPDGQKLLREIQERGLKKEFNFNNSYNYFRMLKNQIKGKNDSWAVRWYASAFLADMFTLYPYPSIVKNIGFDNSGEHSGTFDFFGQELYTGKIQISDIEIKDNKTARAEFEEFFKSMKTLSALAYRIIKRLKYMLNG